MSRSGYSDDLDNWALIKWRGAVTSSIRGKRGQQFLRELASALDAMPEKVLIADDLEADGQFCTLGVIGCARGVDMSKLDPYDREEVAGVFDISPALAAEIMFENDEAFQGFEYVEVEICGPMYGWQQHKRWERVPVENEGERRWFRMREWVGANLKTTISEGTV